MSIFAAALKALLDDTQIWSREDWSTVLCVEEKTIEAWVSDQQLPTPQVLRSIIRCNRDLDPPTEEPMDQWNAIVERPAEEVTPFAKEMGRSVADYMIRPTLEGFLRALAPLDPRKQEIILLGASEMVHTLLLQGPREWSPRMWEEWQKKMRKELDNPFLGPRPGEAGTA